MIINSLTIGFGRFATLTVLALLLIFTSSLPAAGVTEEQLKMLDMLEQLDQLDKLDYEEFVSLINRANSCTRARDFDCTERALAAAKKVVNTTADKSTLNSAHAALANERRALAQEIEAREKAIAKQKEQDEQDRRDRIAAAERAEERADERAQYQELMAKMANPVNIYSFDSMETDVTRKIKSDAWERQHKAEAEDRAKRDSYQNSLYGSSSPGYASTPTRTSTPTYASTPTRTSPAPYTTSQPSTRINPARGGYADTENASAAYSAPTKTDNAQAGELRKQAMTSKCESLGGSYSLSGECTVVETIWGPRNVLTPEKTWLPIDTIAGVKVFWKWSKTGVLMGNWAFKVENNNNYSVYVAVRGMAECSDGRTEEIRSGSSRDIRAHGSWGDNDQWSGTAEGLCESKGVTPTNGGAEVKVQWVLSE